MNQSVAFFKQQQEQFSSSVSEMMEQNPVKVIADISQQNMEMWQKMQSAFFGQGKKSGDSKE